MSFEDTNPFYGCYGDPVARTPVVDQLAAEGTRYPLAFSTAGVCAPARSAVITGMYPISIGTHHMRTTHTNPAVPELPTPYSDLLPPHVKCFTEYLRAEGWYCTNNWKTDYQFAEPRSAWDECSETAHWRNRPDAEQPFFAVFNPHNTHDASRDRHDSAYDRVRAVRDERFKYLRNYYPQQPYVSWIPFRNAHPIMGELMRLHVLGELDAVPSQFLQNSRPVEELYDCQSDPHETASLANDLEHSDTLERLRAECDRWLTEVGDLGEISEAQMVATWYPMRFRKYQFH